MIIAELMQKGYPLPAELSDTSLREELKKIRALEAYGENTLF